MRSVPEQHVVGDVSTVIQEELGEAIPAAMARVASEAGTVLGTAEQPWLERDDDEPVFVVAFEDNPCDGPARIEVRAPVADGGHRVVPAHREVFVRVRKSTVVTGELPAVYQLVERWIAERDLRIVAAPCEIYWTDFMSAPDNAEVLDVAYPVD